VGAGSVRRSGSGDGGPSYNRVSWHRRWPAPERSRKPETTKARNTTCVALDRGQATLTLQPDLLPSSLNRSDRPLAHRKLVGSANAGPFASFRPWLLNVIPQSRREQVDSPSARTAENGLKSVLRTAVEAFDSGSKLPHSIAAACVRQGRIGCENNSDVARHSLSRAGFPARPLAGTRRFDKMGSIRLPLFSE
jgi:hypothetical protein